jgi:hypothetical protein
MNRILERGVSRCAGITKPLAAALLALGILGIAGAVTGCAGPRYVVADVTRYHALAGIEALRGKTFAIAAVGAEQEDGIAFHQFADALNAKLSNLGLQQYTGPNGPTAADFVVNLKYAVAGPTPDVRSRYYGGYPPGYGYGFGYGFGYGHWGRHWGYGFGYAYDPFFDDYHYIETRQLYVRRAEVDLYRGATYTAANKERVFEGRAMSTGTNGQIEPILPYMLDAIFRDFPGASGHTDVVRVEIPADVEHNGMAHAAR